MSEKSRIENLVSALTKKARKPETKNPMHEEDIYSMKQMKKLCEGSENEEGPEMSDEEIEKDKDENDGANTSDKAAENISESPEEDLEDPKSEKKEKEGRLFGKFYKGRQMLIDIAKKKGKRA